VGERVGTAVAREVAQTAVQRVIPRISPRAKAKQTRAFVSETAKQGAAAITKAAGVLRSPIGKGVGAVALTTTLGVALAGGLAAYALTTAVLNKIKDARERKQVAQFEAAQAYRKARLAAEAQLGRPLTATENRVLGEAFKAELRRLS